MIRNKKIITLLTLFIGVLIFALFAVGLFFIPTLKTEAEEWNGASIESEYSMGTEFAVPNYNVSISGTTVQAESSLVFPSGNATGKKTVVLDEMGEYKLVYTAKVNDKAYSKTFLFSVYDKLVKFNNEDTSVTYGKWEYAETKYGLMVRLASGDTLTFSSLIDVTNTTYKDNLIDVLVTPDAIGVNDFDRMIFTFTDSLDPNVYLKVTARSGGAAIYPARTFMLAGGNGQPLKGYEADKKRVHTANQYGTKINHSFSGIVTSQSALEDNSINISYDQGACTAYIQRNMIIDLDSPDYFSQLWTGFPSGRVRLSIQCDMYNNQTANFCVTELRGVEISENTVSANFVDTEAPNIQINTEYSSAPVAMVGLDYHVPVATAADYMSGVCEVKTRVYYNYASPSSAVLVPYVNGCFKPDRQGNYAIVYEAIDASGNIAKEVLWVKAEKEVALPTVSFDTTNAKTVAVLGEWIEVPDAFVTATSGNATLAIIATNGSTVYDATNGGFRAEVDGIYTVKAFATDYIGQKVESSSYTITVARGDKPVFVDDDPLPKYFISGYSYVLDEYYANDYTSGKLVKKLAYAEVTDKNGTYTVRAGETFRPTVNNNGDEVKVVYKCDNAVLEKNVTTIVAFENDKLNLENYVVKQGVTTEASAQGITIKASTTAGGWEFANRLIAKDFSVTIAGKDVASNYSGLRIVFEDSVDGTCAIEARLVDRGYYSEFIVGEQIVRVSKAIVSGNDIKIGFDGKNFMIDTTSITTTKTISGEPFSGFASNKLYFSIYFEDATLGTSEYVVSDVCGQPMTNTARDRLVPLLTMLGNYGDVSALGEIKTLPAALIADVLTPDVNASLSVYGVDGKPIKDLNGLILENVDPSKEYTINLSEYGRYNVEYKMADTNEGVVTWYSYVITVEDSTAPVITLKNSVASTAKLNETLIMPNFTVTDNVTEKENFTIMYFVKTPSGEVVFLKNGSNSIVATKVGKYEFVIMVMDEAGNLATESIVINVEA